MKNKTTKLPVTPPESHGEPSFPTLAALGILTATTTLAAGCAGVVRSPVERDVSVEKISEHITMGLMLPGDISEPRPTPSEADAQSLPRPYRVGSTPGGGTLSGIARLMYGDASKWPAIWEANKDAIKDPHVIRDGMMITIPALGERTP